jgi:hypothetical protein
MKPGYTGPQTESEFIAEVEACPRPRGYMGGGTVGGGRRTQSRALVVVDRPRST